MGGYLHVYFGLFFRKQLLFYVDPRISIVVLQEQNVLNLQFVYSNNEGGKGQIPGNMIT